MVRNNNLAESSAHATFIVVCKKLKLFRYYRFGKCFAFPASDEELRLSYNKLCNFIKNFIVLRRKCQNVCYYTKYNTVSGIT